MSARGIPTTYLIDNAGKMRGMAVGPRAWDGEDADKLQEASASATAQK